MGVPKRRVSKARKNKRRSQWKIAAPKLVSCPHCHQLMIPHRVCKSCGYYDGRQVVNME
ncbi:50S ribosomal protein L32 [Carboxydothermus ferrireducens]|uniref:Large ribosomal subunit protein bL32 n=1 Tax=Carboxydothermus ferrireducens DSM 11255 TaxID=1119529 RepID=A0ABX2RCA0_9THEO|nr:50S ribosomal protein L32 [Carboxydothermus ferrireducens]NYE58222.1 large subunit ribosomal protein L32 [Carboxydothermus ferrireducens DSM 11255]